MSLIKCKKCGKGINKKALQCYNCGALTAKKTSFLPWLIAIIVLAYVLGQFSDNILNLFTKSPGDQAINAVDIDVTWDIGSSDNIMEAYLTIKNNSQYDIEDLEITCTHYDSNGSRVSGKDLIVYEAIPSNTQKDINDLNMGFRDPKIELTECEVTDLDVI